MSNKYVAVAVCVVCLVVVAELNAGVVVAIGVPGPIPPMSELFPPPESPSQRCSRACNKGCAYAFAFCEWWCGVACKNPPSVWDTASFSDGPSEEKFPVPTDKDYEEYIKKHKDSSSAPSPPSNNDGSKDGSL